MGSRHKWTFNDFVTRAQELSYTPKRFCPVVFKTFLREFRFYSNDPDEYGHNIIKEVLIQDGSVFEKPLPMGLLDSLMKNGSMSVADDDKSKLRDDQIQLIVQKIESEIYGITESSPPFEEIYDKLKAFCEDDIKSDEALNRLDFLHELNSLGIEWAMRILTTTVKSKLPCTKREMQTWCDEVEIEAVNEGRSTIIGVAQDPMLLVKTSSNSDDYKNKIQKFCGEEFFTETKYDGERLQVHKMNNNYRFFSRNKIDYSKKLGEDSTKQFASRIHSLFKRDVTYCVLDCELLVWDRNLKKLVGKNEKASDGNVYDVKNLLETNDDDSRMVTRTLCVFDILHLNGVDTVNWTLAARLRVLEDVVIDHDLTAHDTLFMSTFTNTVKKTDFLNYYKQAMEERLEGIVVKSMYSTYMFGSRAQANGWFKIKPDYGSAHTLDLAVVAVRVDKSNIVTAFELAAIVSKDPLLFKVVGTTAPHMKRLDRSRLLAMLKAETGGFRDNHLPPWIERKVQFDKNIRFVNIKNVAVVEIRASGLMRGVLRFPSVVCIRSDKNITECDTIKDVEEYENTLRKVLDADNDANPRKIQKRRIKHSIPIQFKKFRSSNVDADAKEVALLGIKDSISPLDVDDIAFLGFRFVPNYTRDCAFVVTDEPKSFKLTSVIKKNTCHVIRGDWLRRCRDNASLVAWKSEDVIHNSPNASISMFADSDDVEVADGEEEEEEERESMEEALQDVIDADSDPEALLEPSDDELKSDNED